MWQAFYLRESGFDSFDQSSSLNENEHLCVAAFDPTLNTNLMFHFHGG